jgi:hypothetical protein
VVVVAELAELRQLPVHRLCQALLRFPVARLPLLLLDRDVEDRVLLQEPAPEAQLQWI